ncbi:MAG TPA: hypothetical protein VNT42_02665 [Sphingomonas sp.]|nr:hypothetical protein [Sphingomonas sp.]
MDASYFSAIAGLTGAGIGGLTSLATSWITQQTQSRQREREIARTRRERLFTAFIEEASRLFADAIGHEKDDVNDLVRLYALVARMRLAASPSVIEAAERVVLAVIAAYQAPNRTLRELHLFAREGHMDPLLEFSEACRAELIRF